MPRLKAPQRREQLIDVATKLFARTGYDATTTAAIAEAAGVTEPILYRHFKSKQELFIAIVRSVSKRTLDTWEHSISTVSDPAERIRVIAEVIPSHVRKLADSYHVLHGALASTRDKKVLSVIRDHYEGMEKFFVKIITEGQKVGVFRRDMSPAAGAWMLISSGIGYAMIALNLGDDDESRTRQVIEAIIKGLTG